MSHPARRVTVVESLETRMLLDGSSAEYHIDVGSKKPYQASNQTPYVADTTKGLAIGGSLTKGKFPVAGTSDAALFDTYRTGKRFAYTLPAADDTYQVTLKFVEPSLGKAGKRVFDVQADDVTVLSDFDIFTAAGGAKRTAVTETFNTTVTSNMLSLVFAKVKGSNPLLCSIDVIDADSVTASNLTTPTTPSTPTAPTPPTTPTTPTTPTAPAVPTITWHTAAKAPMAIAESHGVVVNGKLYVFGGYNITAPSYQATNHANVYNPATNTWSALANVPNSLTHVGIATDGTRYVYIAGGYTPRVVQNNPLSQYFASRAVYRYDTQTNTWSTLPDLPAARGAGAMVLLNNQLHYVAGVDINRVDQTTHSVLDLGNTAAGWTTAAPLPVDKNHLSMVVLGGDIYALGGQIGTSDSTNNQSTMYRYDPTTKAWTQRASMPFGRSHAGSSTWVSDGELFIAGGISSTSNGYPIDSILMYDPARNTWQAAVNLPSPRHSGVGEALDDNTFIYTTGYDNGLQQQTWIGTVTRS